MTDFKNLYTDEELKIKIELLKLIPIIKNKYFSLGRDIDKFLKLCGEFDKKD